MNETFPLSLLTTCQNFAERHDIAWRNSFLRWDLPPHIAADFTLTLPLVIAAQTRENPREIAQALSKLIVCPDLEWTITNQGYINFSFSRNYYQRFLQVTWQQEGQNFRGGEKKIRVNLEYVSANPTGYLHLAHLRQAIIGDTLANVYQFLGYEVTREYYINDRGEQITSLINSVYYFYHKFQDVSYQLTNNLAYPGRATQDVARYLIQKWGKKFLHCELDQETLILWKKEVLGFLLSKIRQDLVKCGVNFDRWFSETSCYANNHHLEFLEKLREKKLIYRQDGATFFGTSLTGDAKDRVIIKKGGDYTYFFSDILYHQDKLNRADWVINIWGADHHGFISRLKGACQLLGYDPNRIKIILVQMLSLLSPCGEVEKVSKRLGNTIELDQALQYLEIDQLKYFLLEKEPNQPLVINISLLQKNQEKTRLYYIQYAHARCHQIFRKAQEKEIMTISSHIDLLTATNERKIFNLLIRLGGVLANMVAENKPHHLIHYLSELAQAWQVYYQNSPILVSEKPELTSQKLLLVKNIQIILQLGLNLMGIEAPVRMEKTNSI